MKSLNSTPPLCLRNKEPNANEATTDTVDGLGGGDAEMESRYETLMPSLGRIEAGHKEALTGLELTPRVADSHPHPRAAD